MPEETPTLTSSQGQAPRLPRLIVQLADGTRSVHWISGRQTTVGRDPSNDVCIPDHFVSKFHARITQVGELFTLRDVESANQTRVNGDVVRRSVLRFGDRVQFAGVPCRFLAPEPEVEEDPAQGVLSHLSTEPPASTRPRGHIALEATENGANHGRAHTAKAAIPGRRGARGQLFVASLFVFVALAAAWLLRTLPPSAPIEASGATLADTEVPSSSSSTVAPAFTSAEPVQTFDAKGAERSPRALAGPPASKETGAIEAVAESKRAGRLEDARARLRALLEADPQNALVRERLALLDEEIDRAVDDHAEKALRAYREAIAEWQRVLSLAEPSDHRYQEAQTHVESALAGRAVSPEANVQADSR